MNIDVYTLRVFIRDMIWINSSLNAFRLKKISHLKGFHLEQFNILSQFILSLKSFITNLTFEKFQIFCHESYIWKNLIMNNFIMLPQFMWVFFQIFYYKSHIWKFSNILSRILHLKSSHQNNFNMLSQFIFSFKYFIKNLTFEKFSSWTILICFLNLYSLSNMLLQISHLKSFKYFVTNLTFQKF